MASASLPAHHQQWVASTLTDAEAKDQLWNVSQKYGDLLKLQRNFADAQKAYIDAEGHRLQAEAEALEATAAPELWVEAWQLEREAKLQMLQKRTLLLQSVQELREIQLQDLRGHLQRKQSAVVWQDDRQNRPLGCARSEADAETFPSLLLAAARAESESLRQRQLELADAVARPAGDLCQRLAQSEHDLTQLMDRTKGAKRLAESISLKQRRAEREALVAADLLEAAMEVQDEVDPAGCAPVAEPVLDEAAAPSCRSGAGESQPTASRPRPSALAPELLSMVLEEVGVASQQLATLSPALQSAASGAETPSTHMHSLSEIDVPRCQVRRWRSPAEESTASTSPSPAGHRAPREEAPMDDASAYGIDLALTAFLSPRRNRLRRSLFSREGNGLYRYGTCRLRLRLAQGELEARSLNDEVPQIRWEPLEDFLRKVEVDQSQRLRRARERAKVLRKPVT